MMQPGKFHQPFARSGDPGELSDYQQYEDFAGILGNVRLASGSLSETSVSGASEKHVETVCRTCSSGNSSLGEHPGARVKFMCSFGGKILPRPGDGKLRYAGGETRIVSVRRHTNYVDLLRKMTQLYGRTVSLKYQLPDEDLDALISVSSDEDLENMMEEYDKLEAGEGSSRLRIFLCSPTDYDLGHMNDSSDPRNTDQRYVDAINGISEGSLKKHTDIVTVSSSSNLMGLETSSAWNASGVPETVSVALFSTPVPEAIGTPLVQSMHVVMPQANKPILPRKFSSPPSAPSSPPKASQTSHIRQYAVPDISSHFHPDQLSKAPAVRLDSNHQEVEGVRSASSSVSSQQNSPYQTLEGKRVTDSPTKAQQETLLGFGNNLDQLYRMEQWSVADARADTVGIMPAVDSYGRTPRVASYGELIPQQDPHVEIGVPSLATERRFENQAFVAQRQIQSPQVVWQQPAEAHWEGYGRIDPMQQSAPPSLQAQEQALPHYQQTFSQLYPRAGRLGHDMVAFRHPENSRQQEDALIVQLPPKSIASQPVNQPGLGAVSAPTLHLGSAPPSPHVVYPENTMKYSGGHQHLPAFQGVTGAFVDQLYAGMTVLPHNDYANRALKPSNMPLDSQEQMFYIEDQITPQQVPISFANLENLPQVMNDDALYRKYEALQLPSHHTGGYTGPIAPPYPGASTYIDGLRSFPEHRITRIENQEHLEDQLKTYNDSENTLEGRVKAGQVNVDGLSADFGSSGNAENPIVDGPTRLILQSSIAGAATSDICGQYDPAGSTLASPRVCVMPSAVSGPLLASGMSLYSESPQPSSVLGRLEGDGLAKEASAGVENKVLDVATFRLVLNGTSTGNPLSISTLRKPGDNADVSSSVQPGSPLAPFPFNRTPSASKTESLFLAKMEEGEWIGELESDLPSRKDVGGGHLNKDTFENTAKSSVEGELSRLASSNRSTGSDDLAGLCDVPVASNNGSNTSLIDVPVASNNGSNTSLIDVDTFGSPYGHVQTVLSNSTSYPVHVGTLAVGLDAFPTNAAVFSQPSASSTGGPTLSSPVVPECLEEKGPIFDSDSMLEPGKIDRGDDDIKGDLEHVAKTVAAAVIQPTLYPSPTLSIQNWEDSLASAELEEQSLEKSLPVDKSLDEGKLHIVEKEVTFQETKKEAEEDGTRVNMPMNLAAIAEVEAISHGLQTIRNSDLEELRELGSGTFGTVYHGKWRGTDVAIKRIKSSCFSGRPSERERLIADFWREAYILGQLHHPNVVAFYGVVPDGPGGTLATVTEYMVNGSLKQVLQKKDRTIDRRKRLLIIMDAAFGMEYLHRKNIVHFDLKCENLLVNMRDPQRPICKVGDLGLSQVKHQTLVSGGVRGTLPWMAPELLNGRSSLVSEKVDVFSFGIVMWELLTGEEPYEELHYGAIIGGIVSNTLRPPVPSWCDPSWRSLMERCWSAEPGERPAFPEIAAELRAMTTSANARV